MGRASRQLSTTVNSRPGSRWGIGGITLTLCLLRKLQTLCVYFVWSASPDCNTYAFRVSY